MDLSKIRVIKYVRLILVIALFIWTIKGSNYEMLYGQCLGPSYLNINIIRLYCVITILSMILALIFRKYRIAFYILLFELLLWTFHFLAFRGWPLMHNEALNTTAYFYYYRSAIYDFMGFFIRILLITSFSWYKKLSLYIIQLIILLGIAGCLVLIKMNSNDLILAIMRPIIVFHTRFFEFLGLKVELY